MVKNIGKRHAKDFLCMAFLIYIIPLRYCLRFGYGDSA